jgi:hypothetical protein
MLRMHALDRSRQERQVLKFEEKWSSAFSEEAILKSRNAKELERAAYIAAHRILMANTSAPELACPGGRRSRAVDTIAAIIKDVFELHDAGLHECADRWQRTAESGFDVAGRRRTGVLLELPRRATS